jgi:hypothetical protein
VLFSLSSGIRLARRQGFLINNLPQRQNIFAESALHAGFYCCLQIFKYSHALLVNCNELAQRALGLLV